MGIVSSWLGQLIVSKHQDARLDPAHYGLFIVEDHKSKLACVQCMTISHLVMVTVRGVQWQGSQTSEYKTVPLLFICT